MWLVGILIALFVGGTIITALLAKFLFIVSIIMFALALIGIGDITYAQAGYTLLASIVCWVLMFISTIILGIAKGLAEGGGE
jgi:hypothetical protein|nr:MAG TPA: hypothetical protein [Caudoviricetes sp.]